MSFDILLRRSRVGFFPASATRRARRWTVSLALAVVCCLASSGGAHAHTITWSRVGTVTTLTNGQLCTNDGWNVYCDSTTPTIASGLVGIGSTAPVVSLDLSQKTDALALPVGTSGTRPTGINLANGEIRYNSTLSGVETYVNGMWDTVLTAASLGSSLPAAGSTGQVQFNNGGDLGASANFFWDITNNRLGIGTASPAALLSVGSTGQLQVNTSGFILGPNGSSTAPTYSFTTDSRVGMYYVTSGVGFAAGTLQAAQIDSVTGISIPQSFGYSFFADTGTGMFRATSQNLVFKSAGSERVRILNTGQVGIGTTLPLSSLSVAGNLALGAYGGGASATAAPSNGLIVSGNVGIGTASPIGLMHIYNGAGGNYSATTIADSSLVVENFLSNGNPTYSELSFRPHGTGSQGRAAITAIQDINARADTDLTFKIDNNNTGIAEAMRINNAGNVGIGTTTPGAKLQVNGGAVIGYSTSTAAPSNGLAVNGTVGVGTTTTPTGVTATVNGVVQVAGTGSEPCTAAQVGSMRYNPTGQYMEICTFP